METSVINIHNKSLGDQIQILNQISKDKQLLFFIYNNIELTNDYFKGISYEVMFIGNPDIVTCLDSTYEELTSCWIQLNDIQSLHQYLSNNRFSYVAITLPYNKALCNYDQLIEFEENYPFAENQTLNALLITTNT